LRRQERLLKERGGGKLELRRWEAAGDVPELLRQLAVLADRAKHDGDDWHLSAGRRYADLATRSLLRCYTLVCGEEPAAALVGYQYGAAYSVDITLFDPALARFSPGTTMVHLAIADLLNHRPVRLIDFGYGKPSHDQQPRRVPRNYTKVVLLRRTLPNRLRWAGFRAFRAPIRLLEGRLRRVMGHR
jgi:CelD/BcsL family acetyltransferase involved in cellulose biosynthesis